MSESPILSNRHGRVGVITLNRPAQLNALKNLGNGMGGGLGGPKLPGLGSGLPGLGGGDKKK